MNINPDCSHFVDDSVGKETQTSLTLLLRRWEQKLKLSSFCWYLVRTETQSSWFDDNSVQTEKSVSMQTIALILLKQCMNILWLPYFVDDSIWTETQTSLPLLVRGWEQKLKMLSFCWYCVGTETQIFFIWWQKCSEFVDESVPMQTIAHIMVIHEHKT